LFAEATAKARTPSAARAVTLLIPFPAQGPADGYGRAFARALSAQLRQEVVVKNTTGMGGMLGVHQLTRSLADGCTIGMAGTGATVFAPLFERPGLFDVFKDLRFLSGLARVPNILVVGGHVPARTLAELLAQARLRPGHWTIGAVGTGSNHVLALLLQAHAGITLGLQPYDGQLPALQDLARGRLDMVFGEAAGVLAAIRVGTAHPLFTADDRRARLLPEVPHAGEVGLPGVMAEGGYCLVAPASSPEPVLRRLAEASAAVLHSAALAEEFAVQGGLPDPRSGAFYAAYVKAERSRWQQLMRRSSSGAAHAAATARD
jgi:tripartite-type tricarboxylate transporter receptor subunit TctC